MHIYYRSSGSLRDLDQEWSGGNMSVKHFWIDTRLENRWTVGPTISAEKLLSTLKWDIVSIQQASLQVGSIESYSPYLENVINRISSSCPYPHDLAWFMAYNRADNNDNELNLQVQQQIASLSDFSLVFPVATAVFNCQANPQLSRIGDSTYGNLYAKDNVHLQEGLPCYIAALSISEALLRKFAPTKTVIGDLIRPTQEWIESIGGIAPNGLSVGVNEKNCLLAQKAAVTANDHMFEIIPVE